MDLLRNIFKALYFIYIALLFIMYVYFIPDQSLDFYKYEENNVFMKNIDHLILFFLLGVLSMLINTNSNFSDKYVIFAILISTAIEFIHLILSYRAFEVIDLIFNIIGCLFGIISLYYIKKYYGKTFN